MPKEARMVSDEELKKLDWAEEFFEQHRPDVHAKRHIVILTRMAYIGTKHDLPQETIKRIKEFLERENIEYVEEIKTNRCQIARDITKDILDEQCKTEDDKCRIAKEISDDIVLRECDELVKKDIYYKAEYEEDVSLISGWALPNPSSKYTFVHCTFHPRLKNILKAKYADSIYIDCGGGL